MLKSSNLIWSINKTMPLYRHFLSAPLVIKNWNHLMKDLENIYKLKELIPA